MTLVSYEHGSAAALWRFVESWKQNLVDHNRINQTCQLVNGCVQLYYIRGVFIHISFNFLWLFKNECGIFDPSNVYAIHFCLEESPCKCGEP